MTGVRGPKFHPVCSLTSPGLQRQLESSESRSVDPSFTPRAPARWPQSVGSPPAAMGDGSDGRKTSLEDGGGPMRSSRIIMNYPFPPWPRLAQAGPALAAREASFKAAAVSSKLLAAGEQQTYLGRAHSTPHDKNTQKPPADLGPKMNRHHIFSKGNSSWGQRFTPNLSHFTKGKGAAKLSKGKRDPMTSDLASMDMMPSIAFDFLWCRL